MPRGGPNLGKTDRVISAVLPHAPLLFVQHDIPLLNQQGATRSHRWPRKSRDNLYGQHHRASSLVAKEFQGA